MTTYNIAVLPGDGIGNEVVPEALRVLEAVSRHFGLKFQFKNFDWSCEQYLKTGRMMPEDGLDQMRDHDAILLGAVGFPGVPDHVSAWELLMPIRRGFEQYVNLRPVRLLPNIVPPLRNKEPGSIDFWIVRENVEGEYSQIGGMMNVGMEDEAVIQGAIFTRKGTDRVMRYAFDQARRLGRKRVTAATKSNGLPHSMPYWDQRFASVSRDYPDIVTDKFHIDIMTARIVLTPEHFDVIVATNLFGDILSDLGPSVTGTIAVAPGANINPERRFPSMFEPVHGSAPDIAGQGLANPIGQIWSAAMMLDHLGEAEAASEIVKAIERALSGDKAQRTRDLGGTATTSEFGTLIANAVGQA